MTSDSLSPSGSSSAGTMGFHVGSPGDSGLGSYFVATYPPFSQWSSHQVTHWQEALESPPSEPNAPLGLYVHIPFCVDRCRYCYYLSYDGRDGREVLQYVQGVLEEMKRYARLPVIAGRALDFIYFGGGTPSLLPRPSLEALLTGLRGAASWDRAREVSFECAPKSVTPSKLRLLQQAGVSRLSLGVQQMDDEVLSRNGRVHLVKDVLRAYEEIRAVGFEVVNLDLMVGLVGQTRQSLVRGLDRVIELAPDSVTIYQMEIPLNTPLYRDLQAGIEDSLPSWEQKRRWLAESFQRLGEAGYRPISAYAMVKDPSRHPFLYQSLQYQGADLLGIGAASFSYLQGVHHQNQAALGPYLGMIRRGDLPVGRAYLLDDEERLVREFVLQLKLGRLEPASFLEKFGVDVIERFRPLLEEFVRQGWLRYSAASVELTASGTPRVDEMIPAFYQQKHRSVRYS